MTRASRCYHTASDSTAGSTSAPSRIRPRTLGRWPTRTTSCSMMGPLGQVLGDVTAVAAAGLTPCSLAHRYGAAPLNAGRKRVMDVDQAAHLVGDTRVHDLHVAA